LGTVAVALHLVQADVVLAIAGVAELRHCDMYVRYYGYVVVGWLECWKLDSGGRCIACL
jgi:hypothetical protein